MTFAFSVDEDDIEHLHMLYLSIHPEKDISPGGGGGGTWVFRGAHTFVIKIKRYP